MAMRLPVSDFLNMNRQPDNQALYRSCTILESGLRKFGRLDWLPYRFRRRFIQRFCDYRSTPSRPFRTAFGDLIYTGDLNSFIDWSVFFFGAYEKYALAFMGDFARQRGGGVFVDVGANVGHHTLHMSRIADHVHAVEPWQSAVAILRNQLGQNGIANVTVHEFALGAENATVDYFAPAGRNQGVGSLMKDTSAVRSASAVDCTVRHGDDFIHSTVGRFDFIKIDTEGYEARVLAGLRQSLATHRPCVIVELAHGSPESFASLGALLAAFPEGYRLFGIRGVHNGYRYRLGELDDANWKAFLDVVALPAEDIGPFEGVIRDFPFYSKPSDLLRIAKARRLSRGRR